MHELLLAEGCKDSMVDLVVDMVAEVEVEQVHPVVLVRLLLAETVETDVYLQLRVLLSITEAEAEALDILAEPEVVEVMEVAVLELMLVPTML
jgi:hypothetical protein